MGAGIVWLAFSGFSEPDWLFGVQIWSGLVSVSIFVLGVPLLWIGLRLKKKPRPFGTACLIICLFAPLSVISGWTVAASGLGIGLGGFRF